ncbi:MAG TPA: DUF3833 family protein [Chthoniobacteraceae bacterium]|nr:DUF3833 family protein [Chthoniobacteraceae bacterium]
MPGTIAESGIALLGLMRSRKLCVSATTLDADFFNNRAAGSRVRLLSNRTSRETRIGGVPILRLKPGLGMSLLLLYLVLSNPSPARADQQALFAGTRPAFDPMIFFTGHTRSWGVFENRSGEPTEILRTETWGHLVHGELQMEQDLFIGNKPRTHRSWRMRRIDAHHFEATANDIIGTVCGKSTGSEFSWSFTVALEPGNPLFNVRMTQHMYLQPDGKTMVNRDTIRKFGILLAEVTEQFRHL